MKLSEIHIENYRGFYGENMIKFDTKNQKKPINLVVARNDTGKTTLLNSIYWCLYGEEQFSSSRNKGIKIASNKKISETPMDGKFAVKVKIILSDDIGVKYELERHRTYKRVYDEKKEVNAIQSGEDYLCGLERNDKRTGFEEIKHISAFIESNLPKAISTFFFLDGEELKVIFTSDIHYKIKNSIEKVANIEAINSMIRNLKELYKRYSQKTSELDPDYGAVQTQIDMANDRRERYESDLKKVISETEKLKKQLIELEDFLKNHDESMVREYGLRANRIREENERINQERKDYEDELNELAISSYILLNAEESLSKTSKKFSNIIKSGNFPPAVDPDHLKQLLKRGECICGTRIKRDSKEEKKLRKLADIESYGKYQRVITEGDSRIPEMINSLNEKIKKICEVCKKIAEYETQLEGNKKEFEDINQKLKESNSDEVREKAEEKEQIERALLRNQSEITTLNRDIEDVIAAKKEYELKQTQRDIKERSNKLLVKKSEKCKQLIKYAEEIKESILKKIKDKIEETTAQNFIDLHWKAEEYEKVSISDDFSLSIRDKHKGEIINELSQGAALCFGLAFMTALRNYSGYDVPIIIDSPVGKIDQGNREKIAKNLPNQLKGNQVVFLVTNAEYTDVFKHILDEKIANKVTLTYNPKEGRVDIENGGN